MPKETTFLCELSPDAGNVLADAAQLKGVLNNLVSNSVDALNGSCGTIALRTGQMEADEEFLAGTCTYEGLPPGTYTYIEIADDGCGMSEETRSRAFEPFFTTKFMGRGLGLSAVLGIVRGHGGAIAIDSTMGKGTNVRVLLPAESNKANVVKSSSHTIG